MKQIAAAAPVNRVAGKTGNVILTAADVGLSDLLGRVQALEGRAQLDVEAVQDILGQMLGESQGHYDDAAGTYTINLPAGGGMTDEQVQDIVGALVRAGIGANVDYDDDAGTLTLSSLGGQQTDGSTLPAGGQANQVLLKTGSAPGAYTWASLPPRSLSRVAGQVMYPRGATFSAGGDSEGLDDTPLSLRVRMLDVGQLNMVQFQTYADNNAASELRLAVYDGTGTGGFDVGELLGVSPTLTLKQAGGDITAEFTLDRIVSYEANQELVFVLKAASGRPYVRKSARRTANPSSFQNMTMIGWWRGTQQLDNDYYIVWINPFLRVDTPKGTINSLDPADFPRSTATAAPNSSGFMVVDDAAKTAYLYWKFSDGSTKKLDLT